MSVLILPVAEAAVGLCAEGGSRRALYFDICLHMSHTLLQALSTARTQFVLLLSYILIK
jgi:hypothetical protein